MLYIHVPFCVSKCSYCGFYSKCSLPGEKEAYLKRLRKEAEQRLNLLDKGCRSVFVGGGNPTVLGRRGLEELVEIISGYVDLDKTEEFSFETNPETLTDDIVDFFAEIPNIRISMGVQRLKESELKILGRNATLKSVYKALDTVFNKINNVNADFIMGVPGCSSVAPDLSGLLKDFPLTHVSAYFLTLEEGTPMAAAVEKGLMEDPANIDASEMYEVESVLAKHGFLHYEISNYAKPGFQCRHNLGYWSAENYIGLGPAAVSSLEGQRLSNPNDLELWIRGKKPEIELLSSDDRRNEFVMLHLRLLIDGMDISELEQKFGIQSHEFYNSVDRLSEEGALIRDGSKIKLSAKAVAFANRVISDLFV